MQQHQLQSDPVRFSCLKNMARSPAHYLESLKGRADSASMRIGRLVHLAVFGQEPVIFDGTRRGKEWEAFQVLHRDADIFTATEADAAIPIIASLLDDPKHWHAKELLTSGVAEKRLDWTWLGRACRGTPDIAGEFLVDLKTTRNAQPEWFAREALFRSYHAQLAWYRQGLVLSGAQPPGLVYIVAVETSPPYPVVVRPLTERAMEQGERLCRLWMERLLSCEATNEWPGYVQSAVELDVPDDLELSGFDDEEAA